MSKLFIFLLFISSINSFMIYARNNFQLSRLIEKKHWNNIFEKLNDNIYYTKCHKWKFYNNKLLLQRKYIMTRIFNMTKIVTMTNVLPWKKN